jgi:hypothetical protein
MNNNKIKEKMEDIILNFDNIMYCVWKCRNDGHIQSVSFTVHHMWMIQVCYDCKTVRRAHYEQK